MANPQTIRQELARADAEPARPTVLDLVRRQAPAFETVLAGHMASQRFTRVAITALRKDPALLECSPESVLGALMLSAQYGLEPGPAGHVYLIPRRNRNTRQKEVQWLLGYLGMIELAGRHGVAIDGDVVCENDPVWRLIRTADGDDFVHEPALDDRGEVKAAWARARRRDGVSVVRAISLQEIAAARARSEAPDRAWKTDFAAMAIKTAIRRLWKFVGGIEGQAIEADGRVVYGAQGSTEVQVDASVERPEALEQGQPEELEVDRGGLDEPGHITDDSQPATPPEDGSTMTTEQYAVLRECGITDELRPKLARVITAHREHGPTTSTKELNREERAQMIAAARAFDAEIVTVGVDDGRPVLVDSGGETIDPWTFSPIVTRVRPQDLA